jgi:hypothetical protein
MADTGGPVVKKEDYLAFLRGYTPENKRAGDRDMLAGRYRILTAQPLPELSSPYAKAFAVRDEKDPEAALYALVFENGVPLRQKNITALKTFRHPALVPLLASGATEIGTASETRQVAVLGKPGGQLLSHILEQRSDPVPESILINQFLRPLIEIVVAFSKLGISHNRIHPGNIYISGRTVTLGECIGEPSGFSQDYIFEPIERVLTASRAKADFGPTADCYAIAMIALHLALGFPPFATINKEILIREILNNGAYQALALQWDLPVILQDLFRGLLGDSRRERWDASMLESWLGGRRFNLVMPNTARETSRGFEFNGINYFNRKSLANGMCTHWKEAKSLLADNRLARWLTIHAHRQDTADAVTRIIASGMERTPAHEDETLARVIILLYPTGPLRYKQIAVATEAIGALLAHAFMAERHDDVRTLMQMIETDLTGFWIEQQKTSPEFTALSAKLQKVRQHLRMSGPGFGMERCLYDLNPGLPCLSPILNKHPALTLAELMEALDAAAREKAASDEPGDAHIQAFIASRLDMNREIKLHEMQSLPKLMTHPTLVMLKLLAFAQRKSGGKALQGLTHWIALKLLPLLDDMHHPSKRQKMSSDLRDAANTGSLEAVADLFFGGRTFEADIRDFQRAAADYAARKNQIATLKGASGLIHQAGVKGLGVAQSIAYGSCIATVYFTLKSYFSL